jgi:hypothetical protein
LSHCHACRHAFGNAENPVNIDLSRCHAFNCQPGGEKAKRISTPGSTPVAPQKLAKPLQTGPGSR